MLTRAATRTCSRPVLTRMPWMERACQRAQVTCTSTARMGRLRRRPNQLRVLRTAMRVASRRALASRICSRFQRTTVMRAEVAPHAALGLSGLLGLLRLASPGLPVGTFSYSRGLEGAVAAGWVHDEASAAEFVLGVLERSVCSLEGPILLRIHAAHERGELAEVERWALWLRASRESRELLLEDEQMGLALRRVLTQLGSLSTERAAALPASFVCMFAVAAVTWGIDARHALAGYFWAYCESQTSAALRLLPLGQSAGQRLLQRALPVIEGCVERASALGDDEIGNFALGVAFASAQHETQYSRLFRS